MEPKIKCRWCGAGILPCTAEMHQGRCVPCSRKSWLRHYVYDRIFPTRPYKPPRYDTKLHLDQSATLAAAFNITNWTAGEDVVDMISNLDNTIFVDWREVFADVCDSLQHSYPEDFAFENIDFGPPERVLVIDARNRSRTLTYAHDNTKDGCCPSFFAALNRFYGRRLVFFALTFSTGSDTWGYVGRDGAFWEDLQLRLGREFRRVFTEIL